MPKIEKYSSSQYTRKPKEAPKPSKEQEYAKRLTREKAALMLKVDEALAQARGEVVVFKQENVTSQDEKLSTTINQTLNSEMTYEDLDNLNLDSIYTQDFPWHDNASLVRDSELNTDSYFDELSSSHENTKSFQVDGSQKSVLKLGNFSTGLCIVTVERYKNDKHISENTFSLNGLEISEEEYKNLKSAIEKKIDAIKVEPNETNVDRYFAGVDQTEHYYEVTNRIGHVLRDLKRLNKDVTNIDEVISEIKKLDLNLSDQTIKELYNSALYDLQKNDEISASNKLTE